MWVYHVIIILSFLLKDIICQYPNGYSIQILNPSVTVEEGLCVTVPCGFVADYTTTFKDSKGLWMIKANSIVASNKAVARVKDNFHMTGDPDKRDCTLTITDARRDDIGEYYFRFEKSDGSPVKNSYNRHPISVTVTDLTQLPEISIPRKLLSGQEVTLTCSPPVNCSGTPPIFQWTKSNQNGIWKNSSTVIFTPSWSDHNQSITCEVTFPTVKKSTQKTVILDVHYPPSIKIEGDINDPPRKLEVIISSSQGRKLEANLSLIINEGESLTVNCTVDGNPSAAVSWIKGEVDVASNNLIGRGSVMSLVNITSSEADVYRCLAWNRHGVIEKRIQFKIIQDTSNYPSNHQPTETSGMKSTLRDIMIGFVCGIGVVVAILVISKLVPKMQSNKKPVYEPTEELPPTEEPAADDPNDVYMNVNIFEQRPEEINDTSEQLYSNNITAGITDDQDDQANQEELHYSTITFPAAPHGVSSSEPTTEYAEIKVR
ncbi:sialic acid-binding Ig-like lectin 6 [Mixophyes fleayi]|uniref:sialic acid-binding Ig-like lectin 6 n=1 Tax=Mixophyes fleayi TaxID=3061075 RepID=UPI003F4DEC57